MPVILNVITEATGAKGGRLLHEGQEVGWVGDVDGVVGVEFDLSAGDSASSDEARAPTRPRAASRTRR